MKTQTNSFFRLMRINFKSYPNFSVIISLCLILFVTWMSGLVTACFAQSPWTQKTDMPISSNAQSSCVLDGKIYALGGQDAKNKLQVFDPISNTWTYITDMPTARIDHTSSLVNGKIYIIGGGDDDYVCIPEVDVFDPMTNE